MVREFRERVPLFDPSNGDGAMGYPPLHAQQRVLQGRLEVSLIHWSYGQRESLHTQGRGMMWLWEGRAGRHIVRALLSVQKPYDCNSISLIGEANWV